MPDKPTYDDLVSALFEIQEIANAEMDKISACSFYFSLQTIKKICEKLLPE